LAMQAAVLLVHKSTLRPHELWMSRKGGKPQHLPLPIPSLLAPPPCSSPCPSPPHPSAYLTSALVCSTKHVGIRHCCKKGLSAEYTVFLPLIASSSFIFLSLPHRQFFPFIISLIPISLPLNFYFPFYPSASLFLQFFHFSFIHFSI
jgi:hypothetical protein